jgi:mono/diheme cytochrome c family protein
MKLNKKYIVWAIVGITSAVGFTSCTSEGNNPGIEYAPNMYISDAYEAYTQEGEMKYNPLGMTMRLPVEGTIARGQLEYTLYSKGYEESAAWTSTVKATKSNVDVDGKALYMTFCQHCHGKTGKNDGKVVTDSEFPPPPFDNFQSDLIKNLAIGKIYHSISYGKGMMGSHASQITPTERWKIAHFVQSLSFGDSYQYEADETADVQADTTLEVDATLNTPVVEPEATTEDHENEAHH